MRTSNAVVWLSALIAVLALLTAGISLFWQDGGSTFTFTTLRRENVEIYGQGLYEYDSLFRGAGNRGTDAVVLFVGIPLLLVSTVLYRRGSLRGRLLLMGTLAYFLYVYATLALGTAYNELFLLYVALFSASFFAFVLSFLAIDVQAMSSCLSTTRLPRRGIGLFMFVVGLFTLVVWGLPLGGTLVRGEAPGELESYTTLFTHALDLAIIVPAALLSGILILRNDPLGYLIAFPLLVILVLLGPVIVAQTVSQVSAGVSFTTAEMVGPIAGFTVLSLIALWAIVVLLRSISEQALSRRRFPKGTRS